MKPSVATLFALLMAGAALLATGNALHAAESGLGSVRLQGNAEALRLEVHDSTVAAVLAAMRGAFDLQYRSITPLNGNITGTYAGSLARVMARVLDGYDYTIKYKGSAMEVAVLGRSSGRPVPAPVSNLLKPAAVASVRRGRCGRSAGHQAACRPI